MEQYLTPMGPTKLHVQPLFEIGPLEPRYRCGVLSSLQSTLLVTYCMCRLVFALRIMKLVGLLTGHGTVLGCIGI